MIFIPLSKLAVRLQKSCARSNVCRDQTLGVATHRHLWVHHIRGEQRGGLDAHANLGTPISVRAMLGGKTRRRFGCPPKSFVGSAGKSFSQEVRRLEMPENFDGSSLRNFRVACRKFWSAENRTCKKNGTCSNQQRTRKVENDTNLGLHT